MKLRQPSQERNKEFFVLVQTLFNQEVYIVGSNLFNYYEPIQLDDLNKCEKFRAKTARMNMEGQSCFLDLIDTEQNQLAGCVGFVKVNRIDREAFLAFIFYQQYFDYIGEAIKCFFTIIRSPKNNLRSLICNASGCQLSEEAIEVLFQLSFVDITGEKKRSDDNPLWMRYTSDDATPSDRPSRAEGSRQGADDGDDRWSNRSGPGSIKEVCRYWARGSCKFGDDCRYLHNAADRGSSPQEAPSPAPSSAPSFAPPYPPPYAQGFAPSFAFSPQPAQSRGGPPPQMFMYQPQMAYVMPAASPAGPFESPPVQEYMAGMAAAQAPQAFPQPTFIAEPDMPQLVNASFSSYSSVSADSAEVHDLSQQQSLNLSSAPSLDGTQALDQLPPGPHAKEPAVHGIHSDDSAATARMYDRSAVLAQRARAEVAELLELVNTAHPQWLQQMRYGEEFSALRAAASISAAKRSAPQQQPAQKVSGKEGGSTPVASPRRLTARDLEALDRFHAKTAASLPAAYRSIFARKPAEDGASEGSSASSTDAYVLESVHEAASDDFFAVRHGSLSDRAGKPRDVSEQTKARRASQREDLLRVQREQFLAHCLLLDPQGAPESMVQAARHALSHALPEKPTPPRKLDPGGDLESLATVSTEPTHVERHASATKTASGVSVAPFTPAMVEALIRHRQQQGPFTSIPSVLAEVGLTSSAASAESLLSLNAALAHAHYCARLDLLRRQQYALAVQHQYRLQQQHTQQQEQAAELASRQQQAMEQEAQELEQQQQQQQQQQMRALMQQQQQFLRMGPMGVPGLQQSVQDLSAQPAFTTMLCAVPGMPGMQTLVPVPSAQVSPPELQGRYMPQQYAVPQQVQPQSLPAMYAAAQQPQVLVPAVDALEAENQQRTALYPTAVGGPPLVPPSSPAYTPPPAPMAAGAYTAPAYLSLQPGTMAVPAQISAPQQPPPSVPSMAGYGTPQSGAMTAGGRVFGAVPPIQVSPRGIYPGSQLGSVPQAPSQAPAAAPTEYRAYVRGNGGNGGAQGNSGGGGREGQRSGSFSIQGRVRRGAAAMEESPSPSASGNGSTAGLDTAPAPAAPAQTAAPAGSSGGIAASDSEKRGNGGGGRHKKRGGGGRAKTAPPLPG